MIEFAEEDPRAPDLYDDIRAGREELMTPAEVGKAFGVDPKTVTVWDRKELLTSVRTPTGERRYLASTVRELRAAREETRR